MSRAIICRYYKKWGHIEYDCRKKQCDQDVKGRRFLPQANNASLQPNSREFEDGENNFTQAFMCKIGVT